MGILWMNQGAVEISDVPSVFLFYPPEIADTSGSVPELSMEAVSNRARIESEEDDTATLFEEFVKLKTKSGLYGTFPGIVEYGAPKRGRKNLPVHSVDALVATGGNLSAGGVRRKNHAIVSRAAQTMEARRTGMPAFISSLAFNHGTLYGVLAVLIAVFRGAVDRHHI